MTLYLLATAKAGPTVLILMLSVFTASTDVVDTLFLFLCTNVGRVLNCPLPTEQLVLKKVQILNTVGCHPVRVCPESIEIIL